MFVVARLWLVTRSVIRMRREVTRMRDRSSRSELATMKSTPNCLPIWLSGRCESAKARADTAPMALEFGRSIRASD